MTRDIWINLPVKDVAKSKAFFQAIGFTFNTKYGDSEASASLMLGEKYYRHALPGKHIQRIHSK